VAKKYERPSDLKIKIAKISAKIAEISKGAGTRTPTP
jgi:hypothetical protein